MTERQLEDMPKRPSLFQPKAQQEATGIAEQAPMVSNENRRDAPPIARPPSRAGKRVLSVYLDPLAWKQLRQLALDTESTTQALGEEAVNLLFAKHGLNRSA
jgi:hypothetical protein